MKKLFTLLLVLLLSVGLAVPAMAFTSDSSEKEDHPYDLSIYLVEYDDNDFFGLATLPESDRGYAKNEIVAAVVELFVPKNEEILWDEYSMLVFGGENVDLDVADNYDGGDIDLEVSKSVTDLLHDHSDAFDLNSELNDDDEIQIDIGDTHGFDGKETYKWLFFAKVTGDDASLYAKLIDGEGSRGFEGNEGPFELLRVTLSGTTYDILFGLASPLPDEEDFNYIINWSDDGDAYCIVIVTDDEYKSTGMAISPYGGMFDGGVFVALGVNTKHELGIVDPDNPAKILTDGDLYDDVMDVYEDVVVDVFGLDYFNIGNYVRKSYFEDLVSGDTIIATVDIEPWTAYVAVPDNIVVDPPKTGDAASIMGFVMVALSAAGAVALKKRG
ncbi:MAG: hypothetical protein AAGU32_00190 [Bacillota bacterium]